MSRYSIPSVKVPKERLLQAIIDYEAAQIAKWKKEPLMTETQWRKAVADALTDAAKKIKANGVPERTYRRISVDTPEHPRYKQEDRDALLADIQRDKHLLEMTRAKFITISDNNKWRRYVGN